MGEVPEHGEDKLLGGKRGNPVIVSQGSALGNITTVYIVRL